MLRPWRMVDILSFEGTILSEVPVAFVPEQLDIVVNRDAPTLNIVTPIAERFEDSDPLSPGTQVAVEVDVCGAAGQTIQLDTAPFCQGLHLPFKSLRDQSARE